MTKLSTNNHKTDNEYYPTPPWAVRAFIDTFNKLNNNFSYLEPACGQNLSIVNVLKENNFSSINYYDIMFHDKKDFLTETGIYDVVITNPPFNLTNEFILKGLEVARHYLILLLPTQKLEGITRYNDIYAINPPSYVYQHSERVTMYKNKVVNIKKEGLGGTTIPYAWYVWDQLGSGKTKLSWIPPKSKERFEKPEDYN